MTLVHMPQGKIMDLLNELPPDKLKQVIEFAEALKTEKVKKNPPVKNKKRNLLPTFHLGQIAKDALNRDTLYGEHLSHKFD